MARHPTRPNRKPTMLQTTSAHPSDAMRGLNATGLRALNERLILSLVRRRPGIAKAEIARATGLSAQAVSVIVRALEVDGLLERLEPVRGRVGQPSVPLKLAADGAYSFGLKIGRRSADLVLTDFLGAVLAERHWTYPYPDPFRMLSRMRDGVRELSATLPEAHRPRIVGVGVATPFEIWNWVEEVGGPADILDAWRNFDVRGELESVLGLPVCVSNDATAACGAELAFGGGARFSDFVYIFVGSFVGGGVVLNGALHSGRRGNAGALGSMPTPKAGGGSDQLIRSASLVKLEAALEAEGQPRSLLFDSLDGWERIGAPLDAWIDQAGSALAHAIASAIAVIDFDAAVIDGWLPPAVRARLVERVRLALGGLDLQGLSEFEVVEGLVGPYARAIGAASLPLEARFLIERAEAAA